MTSCSRASAAKHARSGRVAGHAVDAVDADHSGAAPAVVAQQRLELVEIVVGKALDGGAAAAAPARAVVDRLVRAAVQKQRPAARQHREHRHVDVGDRRQHEGVLAAEQLGQLGLDLLVEDRAAEQARPARMRAPAGEILGHRLDDLRVEVEPEVVARRVVGQPLVADADLAAVDLVDHGVDHVVRVLQASQVLGRANPALQPAVVLGARRRSVSPATGAACVRHRGRASNAPPRWLGSSYQRSSAIRRRT